jgi:hypothetical protein
MVRLVFSALDGAPPDDPPLFETRPLRSALFVTLALVHIAAEYGVEACRWVRRVVFGA